MSEERQGCYTLSEVHLASYGSRATCPADVGESGGQHTVTKLLFPQPPCPRMLNSRWPAGTLTKGYVFLEYHLKYVHTK